MVQGLSLCAVSSARISGVGGLIPSGMRESNVKKKAGTFSGIERQWLWNRRLSRGRDGDVHKLMRVRNVKVGAGWFFNKGEEGLDASLEHSESTNEDILIFFLQLDLGSRVQYALNMEQYDIAQQLREKITEVETEVIRQQEGKRGSSLKSEAQDKGISVIRLRADLQDAIENEDYALAAQLRDEISRMEAESLAVSAKALAYENAEYAFRLGQKVKHKIYGYRAVICGMDPLCCESNSWMQTAQVDKLPRGPNQPFYQVLVDVHADPNLLVAYVSEDNLIPLNQPDMGSFDHPYISFLFYGMDAAGDFIPVRQLREKFNRPRHEVPYDPDNEDGNDDA